MRALGMVMLAVAVTMTACASAPTSSASIPVTLGATMVAGTVEPVVTARVADQTGTMRAPVDVLFVGNSYTFYNHMPQQFEALAEAADVPVNVEAFAIGGSEISEHVERDRVHELIQDREWDFVVLQGHSLEVFRNPRGFEAAMVELAAEAERVGAQPVLFETWARRADNPILTRLGLSPAQMQDRVLAAYDGVADRTGASLAPVGEAWRRVRRVSEPLNLHVSDGSHPNEAGSYLAACVFLNVLVDEPCTGNAFVPEGVDPKTATRLQRAADAVVD